MSVQKDQGYSGLKTFQNCYFSVIVGARNLNFDAVVTFKMEMPVVNSSEKK